MIVTLDRSYYSRHMEIYQWLHDNLGKEWGNGFDMMFGYIYVDLIPDQEPDEHTAFMNWLKPKKNKNGGYIGISLESRS